MAITFRKANALRADLVADEVFPALEDLPALDASFDQDELVAVAEYLARSVTAGEAEWDACARELSAWADADRDALACAARSASAEQSVPETSGLLRDAATLAAAR